MKSFVDQDEVVEDIKFWKRKIQFATLEKIDIKENLL